jgi:hypothetical protein
MISKKSLVPVLDKSIILTITGPNDNAKLISVQCGGGQGPSAAYGPVTAVVKMRKWNSKGLCFNLICLMFYLGVFFKIRI